MNELLKKSKRFNWEQDCEQAFQALKQALAEAATLYLPSAGDKFRLYTDALEIGIGATLAVIKEDDTEQPVMFLSRKLQPAETRYPTVEKELLAVIYAMRKLRKYFLDNEFTLYCDNTAVCYQFNKSEPSQRLQRWIMCTQEFVFKIKHVSGKKNAAADALSRFPPEGHSDSKDGEDCIDALFEHLLMNEDREDCYEDWLQDIIHYPKFPGSSKVTPKTKRLSLKYKKNGQSPIVPKGGAPFCIDSAD
ncbi:hypothetical protein [Parasitella parasitica]|uniref:Reverse transcriptase/retrotransposon-derived protein RNase H-like domain-containing protein n=1 Tax=Parasitella parasitica TaxID=35722 RepID=A0A0B7N516_9FUNG|nr:hypothetical protein [Parasitella parasitica]